MTDLVKLASPSDDLIAVAVTETFGERCSTYDADCYTCQAWAQYDRRLAEAGTQAEPVAWQWCCFEDGEQRTGWQHERHGDQKGWEKLVESNPTKYRIVKRPLFTAPPAPSVAVPDDDARAILARVMQQVENDLAGAHAEICKLQNLNPTEHTWPEWSPQANTLRWFQSIRESLATSALITAPQDDVREALNESQAFISGVYDSLPKVRTASDMTAALRGNQSDGGGPSSRTAGGFPVAAAPSQAEETGVIQSTRQGTGVERGMDQCVTGGESAATTPSSRPEVSVEELADIIEREVVAIIHIGDDNAEIDGKPAARALKAKYHMEGRE